MAQAVLPGLILSGVGTVVNYLGSQQAASAQRDAARQAQQIAAQNAAELERRGAEAADLRRDEARRLAARQRLAVGSTGFRTDDFFDLLVDSAAREELAAQRIQRGYSAEAGSEIQRGALEGKVARQRARALTLGGTTEFISGLGSTAANAAYYKKIGMY